MKPAIAILVTVLIAGFGLFMLRQNAQQARNHDAVQRAVSAGKDVKPGSNAAQDSRHRERINRSPAGARHQQSK